MWLQLESWGWKNWAMGMVVMSRQRVGHSMLEGQAVEQTWRWWPRRLGSDGRCWKGARVLASSAGLMLEEQAGPPRRDLMARWRRQSWPLRREHSRG